MMIADIGVVRTIIERIDMSARLRQLRVHPAMQSLDVRFRKISTGYAGLVCDDKDAIARLI